MIQIVVLKMSLPKLRLLRIFGEQTSHFHVCLERNMGKLSASEQLISPKKVFQFEDSLTLATLLDGGNKFGKSCRKKLFSAKICIIKFL